MEFELTPPTPTDLGLPHRTFWNGQREGVEAIQQLWRGGTQIVMVNGPTGSGKSLTGIASGLCWQDAHDIPIDITVLTQTRDLQSQYVEEFPACQQATGRANWPCGEVRSKRANQCPFIGTDTACVPYCKYRAQRESAILAPVRAINYSLYGATEDMFHAKVMIADEADYLGELLTQAKSIDLTPLVDSFGLQVEQGWVNNNSLIEVLDDLRKTTAVPEERETAKRGIQLLRSRKYAIKGIGNELRPWPESRLIKEFARQPTLIMSATVFAPSYWSQLWDVPIGWVELPCPVPASARPIHLMNTRKLNNRTTEAEWEQVVDAIDNIIGQRIESKGLIHSVSNWLMELILTKSRYKYMMFPAAGNKRMSELEAFKRADKGILIGPNLTRGINLPDDQCRWVIIPKVPYASMGDARVQDMLKSNENRYLIETVGTVIQACGRGVRHRDDSCETFILDSGMGYLLKQTNSYLPKWFKDAIIW